MVVRSGIIARPCQRAAEVAVQDPGGLPPGRSGTARGALRRSSARCRSRYPFGKPDRLCRPSNEALGLARIARIAVICDTAWKTKARRGYRPLNMGVRGAACRVWEVRVAVPCSEVP